MKDVIVKDERKLEATKLVVQRLGISDYILRGLIRQGVVSPPFKMGNKHYFDYKVVKAEFLAAVN
jgi:hypothetical protein